MRIIGLAIALALVALAAGELVAFIDVPSALVVFGLTLGG